MYHPHQFNQIQQMQQQTQPFISPQPQRQFQPGSGQNSRNIVQEVNSNPQRTQNPRQPQAQGSRVNQQQRNSDPTRQQAQQPQIRNRRNTRERVVQPQVQSPIQQQHQIQQQQQQQQEIRPPNNTFSNTRDIHQNFNLIQSPSATSIHQQQQQQQQHSPQIVQYPTVTQQMGLAPPPTIYYQNGQQVIYQQPPQSQQRTLPRQYRPDGIDVANLKNSEDFQNFLENFADKDNYFCQICQNLLWESKSCKKCGKNFCFECLAIWLQNRPKCPCCRENIEMKDTDKAIVNNLNRLQFKCTNQGCNKEPTYDLYQKHLEKCDYGMVKCKNTGCDYKKIRKDYGEHDETCVLKLVPCKWCKKKYMRLDIVEHQQQCDLRLMKCSNDGCPETHIQAHYRQHIEKCGHLLKLCQQCKQRYKQMDFQKHRDECEFNEVNCQGCKIQFYKKDIVEHEKICPDVEMTCEYCNSSFARKKKKDHTELVCLQCSNKQLIQNQKSQMKLIEKLQTELESSEQKQEHQRQCLSALYDIVHNKLNCKCSQAGDQNCVMHKYVKDLVKHNLPGKIIKK